MVLAVLVCLSFPPIRFQSFPIFSLSFPISFPLFLPFHSNSLCFKTSLPFQFQTSPLSSKKSPLVAGVKSSIYRLEGSRLLLRMGSGLLLCLGSRGAACCRAAVLFSSHVVRGYSSMRENTFHFFFKFTYYLFIIFVRTQKWVTTLLSLIYIFFNQRWIGHYMQQSRFHHQCHSTL